MTSRGQVSAGEALLPARFSIRHILEEVGGGGVQLQLYRLTLFKTCTKINRALQVGGGVMLPKGGNKWRGRGYLNSNIQPYSQTDISRDIQSCLHDMILYKGTFLDSNASISIPLNPLCSYNI